MFNVLKKKYAVRIFFYSVVLLVVQVGLFSDVNQNLESKEYSYNYQLDRWQSSFTLEWRDVLKELRDSGLVLCDENGAKSNPHIQLLDDYYHSMYDLHLTSKYKFHVYTYIFNDIGYLYSILDKYYFATKFILSSSDFDNLTKLMVSYQSAYENSSKLHDEVEITLGKIKKLGDEGDSEALYTEICNPKTPFFNEQSMNIINNLNDISYEMLDNYHVIYQAYVELANYLMAAKLWLTIMLFFLIQWYVMRKDVET